MQIGSKISPSFILGGLLFMLSMKVDVGSGIICVKCNPRSNNLDCSKLDYPPYLECPKDEVCFKSRLLIQKRGPNGANALNPPGVRVISGCIPFNPQLGFQMNECVRVESDLRPNEERCYCNNTDFCNGSERRHRNNSLEKWKHIFICLVISYLTQVMLGFN